MQNAINKTFENLDDALQKSILIFRLEYVWSLIYRRVNFFFLFCRNDCYAYRSNVASRIGRGNHSEYHKFRELQHHNSYFVHIRQRAPGFFEVWRKCEKFPHRIASNYSTPVAHAYYAPGYFPRRGLF